MSNFGTIVLQKAFELREPKKERFMLQVKEIEQWEISADSEWFDLVVENTDGPNKRLLFGVRYEPATDKVSVIRALHPPEGSDGTIRTRETNDEGLQSVVRKAVNDYRQETRRRSESFVA